MEHHEWERNQELRNRRAEESYNRSRKNNERRDLWNTALENAGMPPIPMPDWEITKGWEAERLLIDIASRAAKQPVDRLLVKQIAEDWGAEVVDLLLCTAAEGTVLRHVPKEEWQKQGWIAFRDSCPKPGEDVMASTPYGTVKLLKYRQVPQGYPFWQRTPRVPSPWKKKEAAPDKEAPPREAQAKEEPVVKTGWGEYLRNIVSHLMGD